MRAALVIVAVALGFAGPQAERLPAQSPARPLVELVKTRFAVGEKVFFWAGVDVPGQKVPVPRELQNTLRVILTRPDGTERAEKLSFPSDGMGINGPGDLGFKGGVSLGAEVPQVGSWTVVVEFAGQRTPPVKFTVENLPILNDIDAAFTFSSPLVLDSPDAAAAVTVRNRSAETIRFVEPGQNHSHVAVNLTKVTGDAWGSSFFVAPEVLSEASGHKIVPMSVDNFTWAATSRFPTVILTPGAEFQLKLPMKQVIESRSFSKPPPAGEYDVMFSTELQLLVGEANGPWADFAPIGLVVKSTARGRR